jgi:alpha/beta superfamily hydrolase
MTTIPMREIRGPVGRLETLLDEPAPRPGVDDTGILADGQPVGPRAAVVLAHPHPQYGGTMHTKVVYQVAKALGRIGCAVLRFNFRGAGMTAGAFSDGPGEMDDFRAALGFMRDRYPSAALWAAGVSFGGWVGLTVGAGDGRVSTLLGIALPLSHYDFEAVRLSAKPKFFVQGERDEICPLRKMREFYATCVEPKELVVIDAANHVFDGQTGEVADTVEDLLGDWR